ncbi:hypothetical protein E0Z10_g3009 [Xylaria hypoxylon]|uniref:Uncharacterized protein n=1 Tax=Xylaria hypoxylon TaxID=37992 RepID=A0A4Z0Z2I6_9PEZI|nr:hypothetical protein E0Z10_g3009 [Xylaria hypoxylon]
MGLLFIKLLKTGKLVVHKGVIITTDLGNVKENFHNSPSPEIPWNDNPNALYGAVGRDATELSAESEPREPIEFDAATLGSPRCVPTGAGGSLGSRQPNSNGSGGRASGRANHAVSQAAPSDRGNGPSTPASQSAQGRHRVAPSSYHDNNFPSTGELAMLWHNVNETHEAQVIGVNVWPTYNGPDDLRRETASINAQQCLHVGTGNQIIGQRVKQGARPRQFAGYYAHNKNSNGGEQIIGVELGQ